MTLDARARKTASDLIAKFGKIVTLTRVIEGTYNPATGDMSSGSTTTQLLKAIIKDFKPFEFVSDVIESGDKKVSIAALGITAPSLGDTVTIDSLDYKVLAIRSIWSGELSAIYEMQVRK